MKKGQVSEGFVERVDFPNKGVVRVGEETCIVKNSLPGQKVKLIVNKVRNGKAEARLLEVMEKSPLETGHPCSHFGVCGGCTYLSLPYGEQLRIKEGQVKKLLDSVLDKQKQDWKWEGIKGSPREYEYRNKMEFSFGDEVKDGPLSLGMHKRGSFYDVVTVTDCRIVDEDYRKILEAVCEYFASRKVSYYHRLRHEGYLRHLLVRKASKTGEILIALVTTSQSAFSRETEEVFGLNAGEGQLDGSGSGLGMEKGRLEESLDLYVAEEQLDSFASGLGMGKGQLEESPELKVGEEESVLRQNGQVEDELCEGFRSVLLDLEREGQLKGRIAGILHIVNDSLADVVKSDRTEILYGKDFFYEELLGLTFKISVFSFFQTNSYGAEVLYRMVQEYAGKALKDDGETRRNVSETTRDVSEITWDVSGTVNNIPECAGDVSENAGKVSGTVNNMPECAGDVSENVGKVSGHSGVIFDLYSGTGTIAQLMAPVADEVIGVEIVEEAVEAARKNAEANGLQNCRFIAGDVLKVLDEVEEKPDLIILDPPRDGIHPKALPKIIRYGVEHIVYISCKPTSLVRDLEIFLQNGYYVERAVAVDQFPWTGNVETVCLLSNRKPDTKVRIDVDLEDYYRIKDSKKNQN